MKKRNLFTRCALVLVLAMVMICAVGCIAPQTQEGEKSITVEIVHADGSKKTVDCHTDELYLDKVLVAEGLIEEDNIVNGMFTVVDGEEASWDADQAYWAFYVGEEYASKGICETPVEDGVVYKLIYTK